jgi:tight adherence protein C
MTSQSLLSMLIFLAVFAGIGGLGFLVYHQMSGDRRRAIARLRNLGSADLPATQEKPTVRELASTALPKIGALLLPRKEAQRATLQKRLVHAGYYGSNAVHLLLGMKLILMLTLPLAGVVLYALGNLSLKWALIVTLSASCVGMLLPGLWLDHCVKQRQRMLRNGLPDALDMLVLCMEGGISLVAAFQRVTGELYVVHPVLGREFNILQREIQLGLSAGESLRKMGERCGLDDVRDLASVLLQSERFGASMVKALRQHADAWRIERQQRAEEMAQKAAVKILFPTMLCIFPAIFIVLLGPAAMQMARLFSK